MSYDRQRHLVVKQRRVQRAVIAARPGVVDVALDRAASVAASVFSWAANCCVVLVKRLSCARCARASARSDENEALLSSTSSPRSFLIVPHFRSASFNWRKTWFDGLGHFALHGQQLFFAFAERVRLVAQQLLEQQPKLGQLLGGQERFHRLGRDGHDLGPDVAGGLAGAAGRVAIAAEHPLIVAVGRVLGRFQKGIGAQPLAGAVEIGVELQAGGQRLGIVAQLAAKLVVAGDSRFPFSKAVSQASSSGNRLDRSQVSAGFDLAAAAAIA